MGVNGDRLWRRLQTLGSIGALSEEEGGGIFRPAYGSAHAEAVALVAGWMREAGLDVGIDDAGNLMGRLEGTNPALPAIALGSHLDTVPNGGAFDGALGVLAALEAVTSMAERGDRLEHPLIVLGFADEEGNNFGIGVLSAQLWIGEISKARRATILDAHGTSLDEYLERFTVPGVPRVERPDLCAYLEAHVEQGPVLDRDDRSAAAVTSIVGISRATLTFIGEANHSGTTPMEQRRDAAWGAAELVLAVRELAGLSNGEAVATVGVVDIEPNATNVIPGSARLRVELRAPDAAWLEWARGEVEGRAIRIAEHFGLHVEPVTWHVAPPVAMDAMLVDAVRGALVDVGLEDVSMPSWAGHDAKVLARRMPVGMVFVPSIGGVSHAPGELTAAADCTVAAEVLRAAAIRASQALSGVPKEGVHVS